MRMKIALSNQVTRRKNRVARVNTVDGDRLATKPNKLVQKLRGQKFQKSVKKELTRNFHDEQADGTVITERTPVKIQISTSADVIFNPSTDGTKHSMFRAIKTNLERRMPGHTITVHSISGEGHAEISISAKYNLDNEDIMLVATAYASPLDMAIVDAVVTASGRTFDVNPVDKARSPEETFKFLHRLASNCYKGAAK